MKKTKALYIILAVLMIYMFASIFVTVALTGGRDIEDFTDNDKTIFSVFVTLEIIDVVACFALALRISKISRAPTEQKKPSAYDKALMVRDLVTAAIALVISIIASIIGATVIKPLLTIDAAAIAFLISSILSLLISSSHNV